MITPLCTQLTYLGLVDEVMGIANGEASGWDPLISPLIVPELIYPRSPLVIQVMSRWSPPPIQRTRLARPRYQHRRHSARPRS